MPARVGAESARIIDGSNVTFLYQITVPGEGGLELRDLGQFVQGRHQLPQALERVVTGMKSGDEKKVAGWPRSPLLVRG